MRKPTLVLLSMLALALALPATAAAADRDRDRLPDRWEERHGLSPTRKSRNFDPDRDHVDNANEHRERTDPRDKDSDDDGILDGHERAGVVVSFEDDELTIDLANGGSLSGYVTDWTELACHSEAQAEKSHGGDETKDESDIPEDPVDVGSGDDPVLARIRSGTTSWRRGSMGSRTRPHRRTSRRRRSRTSSSTTSPRTSARPTT